MTTAAVWLTASVGLHTPNQITNTPSTRRTSDIYVTYAAEKEPNSVHSVVETDAFIRSATDAGMTGEERQDLVVYLSKNPDVGDIIPGTGGARKFRIPFKGKGKRGGARVVTYFAGEDVPVFLLDVYAKGDKINLSQAERNELRSILGEMADAYRACQGKKMRLIGSAS